jgi:hypothetical protein
MDGFIDFDGFILRIDKIKYIEKDYDKKNIMICTVEDGEDKKFAIHYSSDDSMQYAYDNLSRALNSKTPDYHNTIFSKHLAAVNNNHWDIVDYLKKIEKEVKIIKKHFKSLSKKK